MVLLLRLGIGCAEGEQFAPVNGDFQFSVGVEFHDAVFVFQAYRDIDDLTRICGLVFRFYRDMKIVRS